MRLTVEGQQVPRGRVRVSGAKNAATRLMAAALLTDEPVVLTNFPTELLDARRKARFMEALGAECAFSAERSELRVHAREVASSPTMDFDIPIRTTYLLAAGQLRRQGVARIPYPGGCRLGERKYDLHVMVWERLGAQVQELEDHILIQCPRLRGAEISFPISTVGGTENALLCASVAEGTTVIQNAYVTPEISNLISLLQSMGVTIERQGGSKIIVHGQPRLRGATTQVMPDRIEALTWIVYATMAGGDVVIDDVPFADMEIPLVHLRTAGLDYFSNSRSVYVTSEPAGPTNLQPFEVACGTHPGVVSDMQPFYVMLALVANGRSLIVDYRYPERTAYLEQLSRFVPGALEWSPGRIRVQGKAHFKAATADSTDLRGSMALVMAALLAEGTSTVNGVEMALRGYDGLAGKLQKLGIKLEVSE